MATGLPVGRTADFDAFWSELKREPVTVRVFGEEHSLPPALPAAVMLRVLRLQQEHGAATNVPQHELHALAEDLFGAERLGAWLARGLDVEQLAHLVTWAMSAYGGEAAAGGAGEDTGPNRAARRAERRAST